MLLGEVGQFNSIDFVSLPGRKTSIWLGAQPNSDEVASMDDEPPLVDLSAHWLLEGQKYVNNGFAVDFPIFFHHTLRVKLVQHRQKFNAAGDKMILTTLGDCRFEEILRERGEGDLGEV